MWTWVGLARSLERYHPPTSMGCSVRLWSSMASSSGGSVCASSSLMTIRRRGPTPATPGEPRYSVEDLQFAAAERFSVWIDDFEGGSEAVGARRPVSGRTVLEADEFRAVGGRQDDGFAFVRESAAVRAGNEIGHRAVPGQQTWNGPGTPRRGRLRGRSPNRTCR